MPQRRSDRPVPGLRSRVAVVVSTVRLAGELTDERHPGSVRLLGDRAAILPDAVLSPPLGPGRIALVLMDVVHAQAGGKRLSPHQDTSVRMEYAFQRDAGLQAVAALPLVHNGAQNGQD